jgi:hypothetical protein
MLPNNADVWHGHCTPLDTVIHEEIAVDRIQVVEHANRRTYEPGLEDNRAVRGGVLPVVVKRRDTTMSSKYRIAGLFLLSAALWAMGSAESLARGAGGHGMGSHGMGGGSAMHSGHVATHSGSGAWSSNSHGGNSFAHSLRSGAGLQGSMTPRLQGNSVPRIQSFSGKQGNWARGEHGDWDHSGHRDWDNRWLSGYWWPYGGWGWGGYYPWYSYSWYPGYYGYYDYGYPYGSTVYNYDVVPNSGAYISGYAPAGPDQTTVAAGTGETSDFYAQAVGAFQQGDYRDALRLASHAAVDNPRDPSVHLLMSLAMFGQGDYRGAAMEAHAVSALDGKVDWPTLYAFYNNVDIYTKQLRALEDTVRKTPADANARFLLGYQYMAAGHKDAAKDEFLKALQGMPQDRIAAQLLTQVGGQVPENIAKIQSQAAQQPLGQPYGAARPVTPPEGGTAPSGPGTSTGSSIPPTPPSGAPQR